MGKLPPKVVAVTATERNHTLACVGAPSHTEVIVVARCKILFEAPMIRSASASTSASGSSEPQLWGKAGYV